MTWGFGLIGGVGRSPKNAPSTSQDDEEEEDDEAEPEDDYNAAWEVLDLARAIYEKQQDESDEVKLKLADVFITLGDVSLETGTNTIPCNPCYTHPDRVSQRNSIKPSRTTLPVLL